MYQKRWRVHRFYTFAVFHFGSLLKSILDHLGLDFGVVWGPIIYFFRIQEVIKNSMIFYVVFVPVVLRFWPPSLPLSTRG